MASCGFLIIFLEERLRFRASEGSKFLVYRRYHCLEDAWSNIDIWWSSVLAKVMHKVMHKVVIWMVPAPAQYPIAKNLCELHVPAWNCTPFLVSGVQHFKFPLYTLSANG
jgi:hypothetical protein